MIEEDPCNSSHIIMWPTLRCCSYPPSAVVPCQLSAFRCSYTRPPLLLPPAAVVWTRVLLLVVSSIYRHRPGIAQVDFSRKKRMEMEAHPRCHGHWLDIGTLAFRRKAGRTESGVRQPHIFNCQASFITTLHVRTEEFDRTCQRWPQTRKFVEVLCTLHRWSTQHRSQDLEKKTHTRIWTAFLWF